MATAAETIKKLKTKLAKAEKELRRYQKGYHYVISYFDSISEEEKPKLNNRLKRIGL